MEVQSFTEDNLRVEVFLGECLPHDIEKCLISVLCDKCIHSPTNFNKEKCSKCKIQFSNWSYCPPIVQEKLQWIKENQKL